MDGIGASGETLSVCDGRPDESASGRKDRPMTVTELSPEQVQSKGRVDAIDLEPIAFKLMYPEPDVTNMSLADADQAVAQYRAFLTLCAWYPDESIVPTKAIDEVWHTHIQDTEKYAEDCLTAFGRMVHHFPYFGLRGADDRAAWEAAGKRTWALFRDHFQIELDGSPQPGCHVNGKSCHAGEALCVMPPGSSTRGGQRMERPRPDRGVAAV